jgi:hypothetical protein
MLCTKTNEKYFFLIWFDIEVLVEFFSYPNEKIIILKKLLSELKNYFAEETKLVNTKKQNEPQQSNNGVRSLNNTFK